MDDYSGTTTTGDTFTIGGWSPVDNVQYGWVCPKCGTVWAPFIQQCSRCSVPNTSYPYLNHITFTCDGWNVTSIRDNKGDTATKGGNSSGS